MQDEAGQGLAAIMARKELELVAGEGLFFWGSAMRQVALSVNLRISHVLPHGAAVVAAF